MFYLCCSVDAVVCQLSNTCIEAIGKILNQWLEYIDRFEGKNVVHVLVRLPENGNMVVLFTDLDLAVRQIKTLTDMLLTQLKKRIYNLFSVTYALNFMSCVGLRDRSRVWFGAFYCHFAFCYTPLPDSTNSF